jgi:hypothetical protein
MATSGVYVESRTALQIIDDALFELGIQDINATATAVETVRAIRAFNDVLFQIKGPPLGFTGMKLWQISSASITPVVDQVLYELKPSGGDCDIQVPEDIIYCFLQETSTATDTEISRKTYLEYMAIANKTATGPTEQYTYQKTASVGNLYIYPEPTSTIASGYTINIRYRQPLEIINAGTNTIDAPNPWFRALKWLIAKELAPGLNPSMFPVAAEEAKESVSIAQSFDKEEIVAYYETDKVQ